MDEMTISKKEMCKLVNKMDDCISSVEKRLDELKKQQQIVKKLLIDEYYDHSLINEYVITSVKTASKEIKKEKTNVENNLNSYMAILKALIIISKIN